MSKITSLHRYVWRSLCIVCVFSMCFPYVYGQYVNIDLRDAVNSRYLDVKDRGSLESLTTSVVQGDVYSRAYANAELRIAKPSRDALDGAYQEISAACDGDLGVSDVTNVFASTDEGKRLLRMLTQRDIADDIAEDDLFATSCVQVAECYLKDYLKQTGEKIGGYSYTLRNLCMAVVQDAYIDMYIRIKTLDEMRDVNYGDDAFANAKIDDAPYDLLVDMEAIGDTLFAHNDDPSEVHFYDMQALGNFVKNDPDELTPYEVDQPNRDEDDTLRRLPHTNNVGPRFPESMFYPDAQRIPDAEYIPPQVPSNDITPYIDNAPLGGQKQDKKELGQIVGPAPELAASPTLKNSSLCLDRDPELKEEPNYLDLAKKEQEQTATYNEKLDQDVRIAIALAGKMEPELEEQYGIDPVLSELFPDYQADIQGIIDQLEIKDPDLEATSQHIRDCLEQHSSEEDLDVDAQWKVLGKTLTQPTAFMECVLGDICWEVSDKSGRGLFHIRGCKEPKRGYGVVSNQPVLSIEEIIDEMSNVCTVLDSSGQLLEHNKTKDAWDHQLMRVRFGDKFSFSLNVGFRPLFNETDPAHVKRLRIENNTYLKRAVLHITDDLTMQEERNKYIAATSWHEALADGINTTKQNELRIGSWAEARSDGEEVSIRDERSQQQQHGIMLDTFDEFLEANTLLRHTINGYTDSLNDKWQSEKEEARHDSKHQPVS